MSGSVVLTNEAVRAHAAFQHARQTNAGCAQKVTGGAFRTLLRCQWCAMMCAIIRTVTGGSQRSRFLVAAVRRERHAISLVLQVQQWMKSQQLPHTCSPSPDRLNYIVSFLLLNDLLNDDYLFEVLHAGMNAQYAQTVQYANSA